MLQIENLSIRFADKTVLHQVSFGVNDASIVGIVGESGSGKSLTSYAITGLLPKNAVIESGKILLNEQDILQISPQQKRKLLGKEIAMIFQEPMTSLNPSLTCGEQVIESILLH